MPVKKAEGIAPVKSLSSALSSRSLSSASSLQYCSLRDQVHSYRTVPTSRCLPRENILSHKPSASRPVDPYRGALADEPIPRFPLPTTVRNLVMDLPAPVPVSAPVVETPSGPKHDEFYKYWDRFMRVKEKSKGKGKGKGKKIIKDVAVKDEKGRSGSTSGGSGYGRIPDLAPPVFRDGKREGPSLEKDVEGRPGHPMVRSNTEGVISRQRATTSYDEAAASCRAKVEAIKRECRRLNLKYYDRMFDLPAQDTLLALDSKETPYSIKPLVGVGSVKRVEDIYEEPEFFIDGATANDIRQGTNGDCWFLAAITALSGKPELINRICIARDEKVGVYGFVFFRGKLKSMSSTLVRSNQIFCRW
jgi:hypothetical protein